MAGTTAVVDWVDDQLEHMVRRGEHPAVIEVLGKNKKVIRQRITKAWKLFQNYLTWHQFVRVSMDALASENHTDEEYQFIPLSELMEMVIDWTLDCAGVEVKKIRKGIKISTQTATLAIRGRVLQLIMEENLLSSGDVFAIKCKLYQVLS